MTTTTRIIIQSSILTLTSCFCLNACVSAGTPGKNAQPNSSSDVAETSFPASPPGEAPAAVRDFAQPAIAGSTPGSEQDGEYAADKSGPETAAAPTLAPPPTAETRQSAPAYGMVARPSTAAGAPSPMADETVAANPNRARAEAKSSAPLRRSVERPGLATLWGETRTSRVTTTSFNRSANQPWSLLRIQYDDEAGVLARTGLNYSYELGSNIVETPNGFVTVQVIDGSGNPLAGLTQGARSYVVGHQGDRYGIRVANHSNERFEIVATVDGLDVLDGRPGSFVKRGYLVDANSTLDIDGFRRSTSEVAAFRFGSVKDSYAARTSGDRNVGVIGVAVFREYHRIYNERWEENRRRDNADPFPNRFATPPAPPPAPVIRD